jgi:N-acetylneuraminic acid mutarotase
LGEDSTGIPGNLNDLWEFNPSKLQWAWMGGSKTVGALANTPGVYGTQGVFAAGNIPAGRSGAAGWTDAQGNLWLFGGNGVDNSGAVGDFSDLWEFNPSTGQWAWFTGTELINPGPDCPGEAGVYGLLGSASALNAPGSRYSASSWTDLSGNLWLFGGSGCDGNDWAGDLNDLWKFDVSTRQWSWMGGDSTAGDESILGSGSLGVYGMLGIPAAGNAPGGRYLSPHWTDDQGNLWLFGGAGFDAKIRSDQLNDFWKFEVSAGEWAWMGGSSTSATSGAWGAYGMLGVPSTENLPSDRNSATEWTDAHGNFWLLGGQGYDSAGDYGLLNDLWELNSSSNEWVWMGGSKTITYFQPANTDGVFGVYGALGTPSAANTPGSRVQAATWTDSAGNLWLFGGQGFDSENGLGFLNDLWEYVPGALTWPTAAPAFSVSSGIYSTVQTVSMTDITPGAIIYYTNDGSSPTVNSTAYTGSISVSSTETLKAIAVASGYSPSTVSTATYTIDLPSPSFSVAGTAVSLSAGATTGNTSTITLTPSGGFSGVINLSCAITPTAASDPATCNIPASVNISGSAAQTTTLTVNTLSTTLALNRTRWLFRRLADVTTLACALFLGIPTRRRKWRATFGMLILFFCVIDGAVGCGGGGNGVQGGGNPGTTPGTYVITVTGTSGAITQKGTVTLTVR